MIEGFVRLVRPLSLVGQIVGQNRIEISSDTLTQSWALSIFVACPSGLSDILSVRLVRPVRLHYVRHLSDVRPSKLGLSECPSESIFGVGHQPFKEQTPWYVRTSSHQHNPQSVSYIVTITRQRAALSTPVDQ